MTEVFQALADPRRRQIVELLCEREQPVGQLVGQLSIAQSGVSRHLRILRDAGLVDSRKRGQERWYSVRPEPLAELSDWLVRYRRLWEQRLDSFEQALERRQAALPQDDPEPR